MEIARAILFQANAPLILWPFLVLMAAFIINCLLSSVLQWRCLNQLLYNKEPMYNRLRPFGCLVYAANVQPFKSKFQTRSHKCIFLGFVLGQKGFLLFDLETQQLLVSRDVTFFEDVFSYSISGITSDNVIPVSSGIPPISATSDTGTRICLTP